MGPDKTEVIIPWPEKHTGKPLCCHLCGGSRGTLVKVDKRGYRHQDSNDCDRARRIDRGRFTK